MKRNSKVVINLALFVVCIFGIGFFSGYDFAGQKKVEIINLPVIEEAQIILRGKGFYAGEIDGVCGKGTVDAWESYSQIYDPKMKAEF
jgi:hypothetical protein